MTMRDAAKGGIQKGTTPAASAPTNSHAFRPRIGPPITGNVFGPNQLMAWREQHFVDVYSGPKSALQMQDPPGPRTKPLLLFNARCRPCRLIAAFVLRQEAKNPNGPTMIMRPIGTDEDKLRELHPKLTMDEAYRSPHVLMPDGRLLSDTDAVVEVFNHMPLTKWAAPLWKISLFGWRPFYNQLARAYHRLDQARPAFKCESCGAEPPPWATSVAKYIDPLLPKEDEPPLALTGGQLSR
jgi:predicted DCC family thiol-disulfide oxidoreductase YuxK